MATPAAARDPELNPYAAPGSDGTAKTRFYAIDGRRITYAEYRRLAVGWFSFLVLATFKTLRLRFPFRAAVHYSDRLDLVDLAKIPPHVLEHWRPSLEACTGLHMRLRLCYRVPTLGTNKEALAAVLTPDDGLVSVSLSFIHLQAGSRTTVLVVTGVSSRLADNRRALTRDSKVSLDLPSDTLIQDVPRGPLPEMLDRHRAWIAANGWTAIPVPVADLEQAVLEREQAALDHHIRRGSYVAMTEKELQALVLRSRPADVSPSPADVRFLTRLAAIERGLRIVMVIAFCLACALPSHDRGEMWRLGLVLLVLGCLGGGVLLEIIRKLRLRAARARD